MLEELRVVPTFVTFQSRAKVGSLDNGTPTLVRRRGVQVHDEDGASLALNLHEALGPLNDLPTQLNHQLLNRLDSHGR